VTLKDLLNDVLEILNADVDNLDGLAIERDEISGKIQSDEPATLFCLPLHRTSFRDTIVSELNNTVVLCFDHIQIYDIMSKVGIFISSDKQGVIEITARILGYYAMLDGGKKILAPSWELYTTIIEKS